jgi:hypothetical protein
MTGEGPYRANRGSETPNGIVGMKEGLTLADVEGRLTCKIVV